MQTPYDCTNRIFCAQSTDTKTERCRTGMKNAKSLELLRERTKQFEENIDEGKVSSTSEPQDLVHIRISSNIHISYIRIFS